MSRARIRARAAGRSAARGGRDETPSDPGGPRLSILHVTAPARFGGLESVLRTLAGGQRERGHRTTVAAVVEPGREEPPFAGGLRAAGVEVQVVRLPSRAYVREVRALRRLGDRVAADVVHSHGFRSDVTSLLAFHGEERALVSTVHGFAATSAPGRLYEWLQRRALRRFDAVAAVSGPLRRQLVQAGIPEDTVRLVPNGWSGEEPEATRAEARRELGLPADGFVVGWVGRLSREKAPDVLLEALERLRFVPWTASIVGAGPRAPALRRRAEGMGLSHRIRWHGEVPDAARLYRAFDVFVLSSRREGTPVVLFEAMAAGVPVVATRVGGVPDVVTEREAELVPPDDSEALAAALLRVEGDADGARRRARAARRRLETQFGPDAWLAEYESLYRRVRPERGARTGRGNGGGEG